MKQCPSCNNMNEDAAMFCDNCGSPLGGSAPAAGVPSASNFPQGGGMPQGQPAVNAPAMGGASVNCPQCSTPNVPGTLYCDNCGADLKNAAPAMGGGLPMAQPPYTPPAQNAPVYAPPQPQYPPAGVAPMPPRIMAGGQSLVVPQKNELVIGRSDLASGWAADVDLTPAGGTADQGISRRHAKLTWQGQWMLEDLDSTNKTYMNGQALVPFQKMPLPNGQVIQMGRLQVTFYTS